MRTRTGSIILAATALLQAAAGETPPLSEFPFKFHDGLIWVEVHVRESARPLNFLLDSGAGASVINLPTAQELGLKRGRRVTVQGVHATTTGYWPQHLSAAADAIPLPKEFLCVDLGELGRACDGTLDGLLGADFFAGRMVQIDFAARKIRLLPPTEVSGNDATLPLRAAHGAWLVPIRVNHGKTTQWVRLDTGCAAGLHWVDSGARSKPDGSYVAVALTKVAVPMSHTSVELGAKEFTDVPTGLHEKVIFPGEAGLLGNGLLSRFKSVTIDCRSGKVVFEENSPPAAD